MPRLLSGKDNTLYVEISLGLDQAQSKSGKMVTVKPLTGIFIPDGYKRDFVLNLILYLHGNTNTYPGDGVSIDGYWDASRFPFFALREKLVESGRKDVILVAPTLGPLSQAGALPLWPDEYFDQVLMALMTHGPYKQRGIRPLNANIILACHSGGGAHMRKIALSNSRYAANILECWGFDCLYGDAPETKDWIAWGKSDPTRKLYVYYCDSKDCASTKQNSLNLKRNPDRPTNITVEKTTANNHFWVPLAHWAERIKNTKFPGRP